MKIITVGIANFIILHFVYLFPLFSDESKIELTDTDFEEDIFTLTPNLNLKNDLSIKDGSFDLLSSDNKSNNEKQFDIFKEDIQEIKEKPLWVSKIKLLKEEYVFVGIGSSSENKEIALKKAKFDALSILNMVIHLSISKIQDFKITYANHYISLFEKISQKIYGKIMVTTNSKVNGAYFSEYFCELNRERYFCYVLLKVIKKEVNKIVDKFKIWRNEVSKNPIVVFMYVIDHRGVVYQDLEIQKIIERFYDIQGYRIIKQSLSTTIIQDKNIDIKKICDEIDLLNQEIKSIVYVILTMDKNDNEKYPSLKGYLDWKKINIENRKMEYREIISENSVSLNNINVAYSKLMKKFVDSLRGF